MFSKDVLKKSLRKRTKMQRCQEQLKNLLGLETDVLWFASTGSTNDDVKAILKKGGSAKYVVRVADKQTRGRGTRGRVWENEEEALLLSVGGYVKKVSAEWMPFLGWELAKLFCEKNRDVRVKWPNDLWIGEKKLAGILCETSQSEERGLFYVIGIGINLKGTNPNRAYLNISQEDKIEFCAKIIRKVTESLKDFSMERLEEISAGWKERDAIFGKKVRVTDANGRIILGVEKGINEKGQLRIESDAREWVFSDASVELMQ